MGDENKFLFFQCVQSCSLVHIFFQYNFKKLWKNFVNVIHKVRIKSGKKQARFWQESSRKGYRGNVVKRIVDLRSSCWYYVSTWFAFQISDTFFLMVYLWHQRIQSHLIPYWIFIIAWKLQLYGPSNKNQMFHVFPRALWTSCFTLNVSNGNLLSWLTMLNHSPYTRMFVLLICSTDAYYPSNFYQIT